MQVIYIAGSTYTQVIKNAVEEAEGLIVHSEINDETNLLKYVKSNLVNFESIDRIIIDLSVCKNTSEEILMALEMIRTMYDELRIIVFAPYEATGSELLVKCFNMGIWNIINTDDFKKIREEIYLCVTEGKKYKDAVIYKEEKTEITIKHEIKKTVNNLLIGVAGSEHRIGTTHASIMLANFFRHKGFMVALVEMNNSGAYECIRTDFDEKSYEEGYFTLNGIDFYGAGSQKKLFEIQERSYNFIILDCGAYTEMDQLVFHNCKEKIIVAGSKPWEIVNVNTIFDMVETETLKKYIFYFNFALEREYQEIRKGMSITSKVYFLNTDNDPFSSYGVPDAEQVFKEYLPEPVQEEKKGFLRKGFLKGKKS